MNKKKLIIGWLYPMLMNTYGDYGNILCLKRRSMWRGIEIEICHLEFDNWNNFEELDLLFMGGAQDRQQEAVAKDLFSQDGKKAKLIVEKIEKGTSALFICGAYQFMGKYYQLPSGKKIAGLGVFDVFTVSYEKKKRLIGNIAIKSEMNGLDGIMVGFENHGGRTYLSKSAKPFAQVIKGYGNNEEDETEGVIYKNAVGTYLHGPILPKNPKLTDSLIQKALEVKYGKVVQLEKLDDSLENDARNYILKRLKVI